MRGEGEGGRGGDCAVNGARRTSSISSSSSSFSSSFLYRTRPSYLISSFIRGLSLFLSPRIVIGGNFLCNFRIGLLLLLRSKHAPKTFVGFFGGFSSHIFIRFP